MTKFEVIRLFRPMDEMGHMGCDKDDTAFSLLGVIWIFAIFGLIVLLRYADLRMR